MIFYFYFDAEAPAQAAADTLKSKGYGVRLSPPTGEIRQWSVIASGVPDTDDLGDAADLFEPWAAALGGEYDGHAMKVG